jgi:predicted metal-dependent enzyme (double-stranded beta helix superfamily)
MKPLLFALLAVVSPLPLQNLPDAFPRDSAKQLIDNERVTVWDVTFEKGKSMPMHRHAYDAVLVDLADASMNVTAQNGRVSSGTTKVGRVSFLRKGGVEAQEGTSDTPRHAIIVELKDVKVPPLLNKSGYPDAFPRQGSTKALDNARVVVWDFAWIPGKPTPVHFHDKDVVAVFLGDGDVSSTTLDGKTVVNSYVSGQVRFNPRDRTHSETLVKGSQRVIAIELK